jgi:hypothetical protein
LTINTLKVNGLRLGKNQRFKIFGKLTLSKVNALISELTLNDSLVKCLVDNVYLCLWHMDIKKGRSAGIMTIVTRMRASGFTVSIDKLLLAFSTGNTNERL